MLLVAHGSRDPRAAVVVRDLARAVRRELPGREVRVAYLDFAEPSVGAALSALAADGVGEVTAVPLLFAPGFHLRVDLPAAIAEVRVGRPWLDVAVAEPLGVAPDAGRPDRLLEALEARLAGRAKRYDAVVLASAGSSDPLARNAIEQLAERWAARLGRPVVAAYATAAAPTVADALAGLGTQGLVRVAVSGLFIAPGRLPEAVRRTAFESGVRSVAEPLGAESGLVQLIADRALAAVRPTLAVA